MAKCGGGKPYKRMSDNPKMSMANGDVRRPYITGGLVGPAMQFKEDDDDDDKKKKGKSYGSGM